jgi:hypothetical protein
LELPALTREWYKNIVATFTKIALQARALWMLFTSFFKDEWTIDDYPIRTFIRPVSEPLQASRLRPMPWTASVINWPAMSGNGNTRKEALEELRKNFDRFKANKNELPRPGARVELILPLLIVLTGTRN